MNKKLLALAVTSALAGVSAGVNADTANVTVYGKLYPQVQTVSGKGASTTTSSTLANPTGADLVSHQEVNDPNSFIGFKGEDNLGGGLKGWFQVEQSIRADLGTGVWSSRNSAVGLSGGFGNVFLGNWDTVYKQLGDPVGFLGIHPVNFVAISNVIAKSPLAGNAATATAASVGAGSFQLRRANNIQYDTPKLGGVTVMVNYGPDEGKTSNKNAYLRDIGIKFEQGPLYVSVATEYHHDFFGASNNLTAHANSTSGATVESKDTATRLNAVYKFPSNTAVGIEVAQLEYKEDGGAVGGFEKYKRKAVALSAQQQLGNVTLAANFVKADKGTCSLVGGANCDTTGLDGRQISLGARYDFSKRTGVYVIYAKLTNGDSAQFNNTLTTTAVNPGVDPEQFGIGIVVSF
jgi:predicted porin